MARILFADDDEDLAVVCTLVLEAAGHVVETVTSAARAAARIRRFGPELVVVDGDLDGADGLVRALRRERFGVPVVLIAGAARPPSIEAAVDAVVPKPLASNELLAAVQAQLAHGVVGTAS